MLHHHTIGKGPDLVLLHGWGMHSGIWSPVLATLSQQYRVTLIDLPGHGRSPYKNELGILALVEQCLAVMPAQSIILGWSLGGLIAMQCATHYPDRISRCVTVASSPCFLQETHWPGMPKATLDQFSEALLNNTEKTLTHFLALQCLKTPNAKQILRQCQQELLSRTPPKSIALQACLDVLRQTDCRSSLSDIQCPAHHIYGNLDAIVPIAITEALLDYAPGHSIDIIRGAAHIPFLSHQTQFIASVNRFIQECQ